MTAEGVFTEENHHISLHLTFLGSFTPQTLTLCVYLYELVSISSESYHLAELTEERQHAPSFLCMLKFVYSFSKVPPNKMPGHLTLH